MQIRSILSPNYFMGRAGYTPQWVILHGTAGGSSAQNIATYFADPASQASTNYVIGQDGTIICCVVEENAPWANGVLEVGHDPWWSEAINPNFQTISIEHVKPSTDNSDQLTDAQKAASFALVKDICTRWNIPQRAADASGGITGHYSVSPISRARCPGPYPWDDLFTYLQKGAAVNVPEGWHDDGTTLTAKNGHKVIAGFRRHILANDDWRSDDEPREEEYAVSPLEYGNPALGSGHIQHFNFSILEWSPKMGVFRGYAGKEAMALRTRLEALLKKQGN